MLNRGFMLSAALAGGLTRGAFLAEWDDPEKYAETCGLMVRDPRDMSRMEEYLADVDAVADMLPIEPGEMHAAAAAKLPPEDIDHHESDLYIRKTPESDALIGRLTSKSLLSRFRSQLDGCIWYELPFCWSPYEGAKHAGKEAR